MAAPNIEQTELARPVPKKTELGVTSDPKPHEALAALAAAGTPTAISKTLAEAVSSKPKGTRAGMVTITGRLSPNQKTWVKIAAAKKGMTIEEYLKYAITTTFEQDGVVDDNGAAIIIA